MSMINLPEALHRMINTEKISPDLKKKIQGLIDRHHDQRQGITAFVLNHGYMKVKPDWITGAGDIEIVNDARTSFMAESKVLTPADERLIEYLGKHAHTSTFRGITIKMELYMPLMTARQLWKYIIGSQHQEELQADEYAKYQDSFTNWNESSRRYIKEALVFYVPGANEWRGMPEGSIKQGSSGPVPSDKGRKWEKRLTDYIDLGVEQYLSAIEDGICVELARGFLPAYMLYVRARWQASLQTVCHFIAQRIDRAHAQHEIACYAQAAYLILKEYFLHGMDNLLPYEVKVILKEMGSELEKETSESLKYGI